MNDEHDEMISGELGEAFKILTLILNNEDDRPSFVCLTFGLLVLFNFWLSHYFIWTSIINSGAVVVLGWLEVVTSSQTHPPDHLDLLS